MDASEKLDDAGGGVCHVEAMTLHQTILKEKPCVSEPGGGESQAGRAGSRY